jgi:hypothetical protein
MIDKPVLSLEQFHDGQIWNDSIKKPFPYTVVAILYPVITRRTMLPHHRSALCQQATADQVRARSKAADG